MSPPWALNQWQRLLPCTENCPFASFLKRPHDSPPSETTGILQSNWIAPGIKHEHAWYDILPRVDWDFIQQLTAGTYTLCWTWMLGQTIRLALEEPAQSTDVPAPVGADGLPIFLQTLGLQIHSTSLSQIHRKLQRNCLLSNFSSCLVGPAPNSAIHIALFISENFYSRV